MKRWVLVVVGVLFTLIGLVWTLQGAGWLTGSPMTGQRFWLAAGLLLAVAGVALAAVGWRARRG